MRTKAYRWLPLVMLALATGCGPVQQLAPAKGRVLYKGKPLEFGSVTFQPERGHPARATIQPDGTFVLTTFKEGDGATVGRNKVRVTCYEIQRPGAVEAAADEELPMGRLMIPPRYTDYDTSGVTVEVKPSGNEPFEFNLQE